jgi:hypothetical protein
MLLPVARSIFLLQLQLLLLKLLLLVLPLLLLQQYPIRLGEIHLGQCVPRSARQNSPRKAIQRLQSTATGCPRSTER